ncbi:MAG: PASTA domain-containing protein, partial [Marmoricola sp.]
TWTIVLGLVLCFPIGLVGLWTRPGISTARRSWVTAGVVAFVIVALALPNEDSSAPKNPGSAARSLSRSVTPPKVPANPPAEPEVVSMPTLVGMTDDAARSTLAESGLVVDSVTEQPSKSPAGTVLRQSVKPGTTADRGDSVDLVVASPLPQVRTVVGQPKAGAIAALKALGFRVVTTFKDVTSGKDDVVLSQRPRGGASVRPGTAIHLVVSNHVKPAAPPKKDCTPGYSPCLPPKSDYDCGGGSGDGPGYAYGPIYITGSDPYQLDRDGDGVACEG